MDRNPKPEKPHLTFKQYCERVEALLKLTGRKIGPRPILKDSKFKL